MTPDSPNGAIRLQANALAAKEDPAGQYLVDARPFAAGIAAIELSQPGASADFSAGSVSEAVHEL